LPRKIVIFIITTHYKTDKWINIQLKYIDNHLHEPYKIYACLNDVSNTFFKQFYYAEDIKGPHAYKLNFLAEKAVSQAEDDDILIFIDGDAFPINNIIPYIREKIKRHKFVAIKRYENYGDIQPHPSFCATTIGFWKNNKCNWDSDFYWKDLAGAKVTDVGGNLLKILDDKKVNWAAMLRRNKNNLHPLWFGIYDNMIYHHGAGFRNALSRWDKNCSFTYRILNKLRRYRKDSKFLVHRIIRFVGKNFLKLWQMSRNKLLERIYREISKNECFYEMFMKPHRRKKLR